MKCNQRDIPTFEAKVRKAMAPGGSCHARRAFTMIEAMVTIGIVIFLAGLTVTTATSVFRQMDVRQTQFTLDLLDQAMQEWEANAGRKLTWRAHYDNAAVPNLPRGEMQWNTPEILLISELLDVVSREPAARGILSRIDPASMYVYEAGEIPAWISPGSASEMDALEERFVGSMTVLDAWGLPIYATHPGRPLDTRTFSYDSSRQFDDDGTIRTYNEAKYGIAVNRRVCFVSAGPDGSFGFLGSPAESADFKATEDNLFSYPPLRP